MYLARVFSLRLASAELYDDVARSTTSDVVIFEDQSVLLYSKDRI
jgi:hypothetical protein